MVYRLITKFIMGISRLIVVWRLFWTILRLLNRRAELERLVSWATRKSLPGPRGFYHSRLLDEEVRLSRYTITSPRLVVTLAYLLHNFNRLVFPPRRYMRRGAAAAYSSKNLTCTGKAYSMK
jgi:hypothetical protein